MSEREEMAKQRARLAEIDRKLAGLRSQCDLAMSAFKFDEANALQRRIAALEDERRVLSAGVPALSAAPERAAGVVPVLVRPRGGMRRRR